MLARMTTRRSVLLGAAGSALSTRQAGAAAKPRNILFILTDDHRYDAMGFLKGQKFLETPHMDSMARDGAHFKNAFVTTALCSPSRASILTGKYAHQHKIVDNNTATPPGTHFFPQDLQKAGYSTAFFGKWHMGGASDDPQPGFDRWVSFRGQGSYLPNRNGLNVDGRHVPQKGYITDELTGYALDWLGSRPTDRPWFLYLSHKAVHATMVPAGRHKGRYANAEFVPPPTMAADGPMARHRPLWVKNQRNSWHGVDYTYHSNLSIADFYKQYAETLCAVDDSVGRMLDGLRKRGELDSTLVMYMGDNGFAFGEHGLIDKRTAYEESMRVPLLARCPELFQGGQTVTKMVANIDIAPTCLAAAGVQPPAGIPGRNFLPLTQGKSVTWRDNLLYEYYWENNYPQTPTMHAIRGDRYKFIRYYGVWDSNELYDLVDDPLETNNLIYDPKYKTIAANLRTKLFDTMEAAGAMSIPLYPDRGEREDRRNPKGPKAADFPPELIGTGEDHQK